MSWRETPTRRRVLLLVAAALLAIAVVLLAAAANTSSRSTVRIVQSTAPLASTVDATGCPVDVRCQVTGTATPELTEALTHRFPNAVILSGSRTVDARGLAYRSSVAASLGHDGVLELAAQCDPGAPQGRRYQMRNAVSHLDLAGNEVVDERTVTTVVPGPDGCTVSVQLRTTTDSAQLLAAAGRLADDAKVQLRR